MEHTHCRGKSEGQSFILQSSTSVGIYSDTNLVAILKTSVAQAATKTKIKLRHETTTVQTYFNLIFSGLQELESEKTKQKNSYQQ